MTLETPTSDAISTGTSSRNWSFLTPVLIGAIGICMGIFGFLIAENIQKTFYESTFILEAKENVQSIETSVDESLEVLQGLKGFYDASEAVSRKEFKLFSEAMLSRHSGIQALEWVPRVLHKDRALYETRAREAGLEDFTFKDQDENRAFIVAPQRDEYFPVYYAEPMEQNKTILGLAPSYHPERRQAILEARDSGNIVAAGPIQLIQNGASHAAYLVFAPVYDGAPSYADLELRKQNFKGAALLVLLADNLTQSAVADHHPMNIFIQDISDKEKKYSISGHNPIGSEFFHTDTIDIAGRNWRIHATPIQTVSGFPWLPFSVFLVGSAFSILVGALLYYQIYRRELVESLVQKRTEQHAAAKSEVLELSTMLQLVMDNMPSNLFWKSDDLVYLGCNQAFAYRAGLAHPKDIVGLTDYDLPWGATEAEDYRADDMSVITSGQKKLNIEEPQHTPDGSIAWLNTSKIPLKDASDNIMGVLGVFDDITDRKQAEEQLRESKNFMELIFDNSPLMVFVKDEDFNFVEANSRFLDMYPEEERHKVLGRSSTEGYTEKDIKEFLKHDQKAFDDGYSAVTETIQFPDGQQRKIYTQKVRFENTQGTRFILGIASDVTEREAELSLLQEMHQISAEIETSFSEKMQRILEAGCRYFQLSMGIISEINESEYKVAYVSDQDVLESGTSFDLGTTYCALTYQQDEPFHAHDFSNSQYSGHPCYSNFNLNTYIGCKITVNDVVFGTINFSSPSKRPKPFTPRQIAMVQMISQWLGFKISEHNSLEEKEKFITKLADSNEELERFAYVCSHDLQEPLRMVRSFSERLEIHLADQLKDDEKGTRYLNFLTDGAKRSQELIRDILSYSSINSDTTNLEIVDLNALIESIERILSPNNDAISSGISWDELPKVVGNKTQLYQLFQNLINNGLKYQKAGSTPQVHIELSDQGSDWQFSIRDNGIGMAEKHLTKIFDVFQRLHRRNEYAGSGIGLSICRKVVDRHGGKIWVESQLGTGSEFFLTLPKLESQTTRKLIMENLDDGFRQAS